MTSPGRPPSTTTTTTSTTTTTTMTRLPPLALVVYPITLLIGSLYSAISPTAQGSRQSSQHSAAMAPSIASDINVHSPPGNAVNYFARKNNIFNLYFVKIGWVWFTIAFVTLLVSQHVYRAPPSAPSSVQQAKQRRLLQASVRYMIATTAWYLMTQWFFGAPIIDRGFVMTGGRCERIASVAGDITSSARVEQAFSAATCKTAGGSWTGGHDISGHVFMLVLATAVLTMEVVGVVGVENLVAVVSCGGDDAKEKKDGEDTDTPVGSGSATDELSKAQVWALRFVLGVAVLGWWMLFMTAIWFHTWLEKWSGLFIALGAVYVTYFLPKEAPAWRNIVGIPGV